MIVESQLKSLDYDDVLLVPEHSSIKSRMDVDLFVRGKKHLPIFSAPMKGVSSPEFIIELDRLGGVGILHRFFNNEGDRISAISKLKNVKTYGIAIGINNWEKELVYVDFAVKNNCKYICIDTATGHMTRTIESVQKLHELRLSKNYTFDIVAGNIATFEGAYNLAKAGADIIRTGIGGGSVCSTRNVSSVGMPDLTAIQQASRVKENFPNIKILADGGIKDSGRAVKAFAFGADMIMIGGLFGKSIESNNGGVVYGMSSYKLQTEMGKSLKSNEGLIMDVPQEEIRPLKNIFDEFIWGIKSGLSYLDCFDLNDLHNQKIEYVKVGSGTLK